MTLDNAFHCDEKGCDGIVRIGSNFQVPAKYLTETEEKPDNPFYYECDRVGCKRLHDKHGNGAMSRDGRRAFMRNGYIISYEK
jgi:hypothetical protein